MKKFLVLSLIGLLVLAFGTMAFAQAKKEEPKLEFKASGFIDAQTHWSLNVGPGNAAAGLFGPAATIPAAYRYSATGVGTAYDQKIAYWESRARLKFDFIMGKQASGTIFFEADSSTWGDRTGGNAGAFRESGTFGYWGGDRTALEIKNVYFDFGVPVIPVPTTLRVGLQTFAIRFPQLLLTDGIGITAGIKVDPATISLIYAKPIEGDVQTSDDTDVYGVHASAKVGKITVGGYGLYYNMNSYPLNAAQTLTIPGGAQTYFTRLIAGTQRSDMWWLGVYADGKVGPVDLNFDFIYDRGKVESRFTPAARDLKFRGWTTRAKVDFPWEKLNFGVVGMYASGADTKKTDAMGTVGANVAYGAAFGQATKVGSFVVPPGSESGAAFGESVVLYSNWTDRGTSGYGLNINYNAMNRGGQGGTWFAKLYGSYKATPWYKVTLQGLYIGDTTKNGNTFGNAVKSTGLLRDDKGIGWEVDLINEIAIWKSVTLNIAGGYLWAGDALDFWTGTGVINDSPKNPWHISTSLKYTF